MSNVIKCFDVVSSVVNEATERFSPLWRLDAARYDILQNYCEHIDALADEFNGESFESEVDEVKMTVSVRMECQDMVIESKDHRYYSLVQRALSSRFFVSESGLLCIEFVFPSVWERN